MRSGVLALTFIIAACAATVRGAERKELPFRIDCWRVVPCDGPENDHQQVSLPYTFTCEFDDPLLPGAVVESFRISPWYQARNGGHGGYYETWMNSEPAGEGSFGDIGFLNYGCDRPPGIAFIFGAGYQYADTEPVHPDGFPEYKPGEKNVLKLYAWPHPNMHLAFNAFRLAHVNVTVRYKEGGSIRFDLDDASHPDARKILIARYRNNFAYSSPAQKADGRIEIRANVGAPGRRVYFRLTDPPDTAEYVPAADRVPNDNVGGPGRLTLTEAVADATGYVKTELIATNRYAGDNYRVEASFDAAFSCAPNCAKTGVLTAWKRIYFENDLMYRRGSFVAAPNRADMVAVTDIRPFLGREGGEFEIIHAGDITVFGPRQAPYRERHLIGRAVRAGGGNAGEIHLVPGDRFRANFGPGSVREQALNPALADGVGLVTGDPLADYYRVGDHLVRRIFADAFVEYVPLDPKVPVVPYVPFFDQGVEFPPWLAFVNKWSESDPAPNHQHLLAVTELREGGSAALVSKRAEALAHVGRSVTVVYVDMIEGFLGSTTNNRTLIAEVAAHEIAHLWNTNPRPHEKNSEHCTERQWNAPGKVCQTNESYECDLPGPGPEETCPEFLDGQVAFHYRKHPDGIDSEYLWIRRMCEPVPNENVPMPDRWWSQPPPVCP